MIEISFRSMVRLAVPISVAMLGLMFMGVVDLMVAGRLGAWATSTVSLTNAVFSFVLVVGLGFVGGVEVLASQAIGEGRRDALEEIWIQALWLTVLYSVPLTLLGWGLAPVLISVTPDPDAQAHVVAVFRLFILGLWPCMVANICRQLLQAQGTTIPGMVVLLLSNIVNALANLVLVLGLWFPDFGMGVVGTGFATLGSRIFMAAAMLAVLYRKNPATLRYRPFDSELAGKLLRLGVPGAAMMAAEIGVFAGVAVLAASLGALPSAAHQSVLSLAAMTFMVPMGIAAATTVLVGQSFGRGSMEDVRRSARYGISLSVGFMTCTSILMLLGPRVLLKAYTSDEQVIELAAALLLLAGAFQIFDGLQVTVAGALRGIGDAKTPMWGALISYWGIGFPAAWWLTFHSGWFAPGHEVQGAWIGLVLGLVAAASIYSWRWLGSVRR